MNRALYVAVLASVSFYIDTSMADSFIADSKIRLER
jgi:hypothetical protein